MAYDFTTLSPSDFEELIADLLSKEWGARLEIFKDGKDEGIDLLNSRVPKGMPKTVVQCKRYGPAKFSQLIASLSKEKEKLDRLKPERYVLVTSVPLSKNNKEKIIKILSPYCSGTDDIYGASEINSLIRSYPGIENAHFKLWISSTVVLERVINAGIFGVTDAAVDATLSEVRKLVPHHGLNRSLELLNKTGHVLIVGNPGIGKTTLARMLLCHFLREDFEPVWVVGNIDEAWSIVHTAANADRKIVLVYDDFLGQLDFSSKKLEKNEDNSLFLLMDKVSKTKNIKFILTTREYILEDAKLVHGVFSTRSDELMRCTLSLGDYSDAVRSKVLFNHLYFSDLPTNRLDKLLESRVYATIVRHRHFNPRVVETISKNSNSHLLDDDSFIKFIEHEFDNPSKLWEHPFSKEISKFSRQLLVALWSYGRTATFPELLNVVESMNATLPSEEIAQEFKDSLRQLDGNFITTNRLSKAWRPDEPKHRVIRFQNPSVREFVRNFVFDTPAWLLKCAASAQNFDQIEEILNLAEKIDDDLLSPKFWNVLRASAARVEETERRYESNCGRTDGSSYPALFSESQIKAQVVFILLRIEAQNSWLDSRASEIKRKISSVDGWSEILSEMSRNYSARGAVERLINWLVDEGDLSESALEAVQQTFLHVAFELLEEAGISDDLWNIRTFVDGIELLKGEISTQDISVICDSILCGVRSIAQEDDADRIGEQLDLLEILAVRLNLNLEKEKSELRERIDEVSSVTDDDNPEHESKLYATEETQEQFDIDDFFEGLRERDV